MERIRWREPGSCASHAPGVLGPSCVGWERPTQIETIMLWNLLTCTVKTPAKRREQIIRDYVAAYNGFDVGRMLANFDERIRFENITNGISTLSVTGLIAFRAQAQDAKKLFDTRVQTVRSFYHDGDETQVEIDYEAVLAVDLPNGLEKGSALKLKGRSIFKFSGDKIVSLTDFT